MRAVVLGAAAGGGFPQWNCRCDVCALAWDKDARVRPRTQSSIAVSASGDDWLLLNASPDIGGQIRSRRMLQPKGLKRHSPIGAVVLTNADIDHIAGLLTLREQHAFRLLALPPVHEALAASPVFTVLSAVEPVSMSPGQPTEAVPGLTVELFPVPGKVALYLEDESPAIGTETGETAGVLVRDDRSTLAYVPGCADLTPAVLDRFAGADVILFDGTLYRDDEMVVAGVGEKTGRRMGHVPISGPGGSLAALAGLGGRRRIYIHINNTNPVLVDGSPERIEVERQGVEIAWDGMEIEL